MRESLRWLKDGGMLAAFPAGEVAHRTWHHREITDPPWNPTIARIVRRTGAAVLPVYFDGHNGKLFQFLGMIHPRLRTAMLPRAVFEKSGQNVEMRIGNPLPPRKLAGYATDEELLACLRRRTFLLQHRATAPTKRLANGQVVPAMQEPVIPAADPAALEAELSALPPDCLLVQHDEDLAVYHAKARQMPQLMREIGRLREITFRATGEGTGRALDLDSYDDDYLQLFIWNRPRREIVGAYRLGPTDEILLKRGKQGLYTTTLFDYPVELLQQLGPALEMGRSFVRQEYQRSFAPLLLLWKGIGAVLHRMPRYRMLFGPVSISNDYQSASRQIMVQFLKAHHLDGGLANLVRPRHPFRERRLSGEWDARCVAATVRQSDDLSDVVSEVEPDQKGIPILLKHYLKLGAKLLSVNLDPDFSDTLDGLIVVDVPRIEHRILDKYMGKSSADAFRKHHGMATAG
jgi:putative hemolysin